MDAIDLITEHRAIFKTLVRLGPYIAVQLKRSQNFSFIYVQTELHFPFNLPCSHIFHSDCTIIYFLVCLQNQKYNCHRLSSFQSTVIYTPKQKSLWGIWYTRSWWKSDRTTCNNYPHNNYYYEGFY